MKITKYLHSCLLIEEQGMTILMDPGNYTANADALPALEKLDFLLITHKHLDHMDISSIKKLKAQFPELQVITNANTAEELAKEGIGAETSGNEFIEIVQAPHEKLVSGDTPQNVLFHLFDSFSNPGDSFQFAETKEILALPIQAPWGRMVQALEKAEQVKPKAVIPVHDWHWKDEARHNFYNSAAKFLEEKDIKFYGLEFGESVEL